MREVNLKKFFNLSRYTTCTISIMVSCILYTSIKNFSKNLVRRLGGDEFGHSKYPQNLALKSVPYIR